MFALSFAFVRNLFSRRQDWQSSQANRSRERYRLILLAASSSAAGRGIAVLTSIISIPLTLKYLGDERFAIWVTLSTFNMLLNFADLGIGNGLLTAIAHSAGRNEERRLRELITSGMAALGGIGLFFLFVAMVVGPRMDWPAIFAVQGARAQSEATPAALIFLACFAVSIPANAIYRVQSGMQQGWVANLAQCLGSIASLLAVLLGIHFRQGLPFLVFALTATPILIALINYCVFFWNRPHLLPNASHISWRTQAKLVSDGSKFLVLQICAAILFQSNPIIIAHYLGAKAVTDFSVLDRLFSFVTTLVCIGLGPLWPAYGDAVSRSDKDWMQRTFRKSIIWSASVATFLAVLMIFSGPTLLRIWLGHDVILPNDLYVAQASWRILEVVSFAMAVLLNGSNRLSIQVLSALVTSVASILLRVEFIKWFGLSGANLGLSVSYMLITIPLLTCACIKVLREDMPESRAARAI